MRLFGRIFNSSNPTSRLSTLNNRKIVTQPRLPGMSILSLPNGGGYLYLRIAFQKWIDKLNKLADHVILVGHLKDKVVDKKGTEVVVKDLDLTGKLKQITCSRADAIGYISRDKGVGGTWVIEEVFGHGGYKIQ